MVNYKITYFNARGRAETARQIPAYAGVPFEDVRIDPAEWGKLKPTSPSPFGQLPFLEVDGKILGQSQAINRFLGRKHGLGGADDWEAAKIDELNDGLVDAMSNLSTFLHESDPEKKKQIWATFENDHLKPTLVRYEKFLTNSGTGYFVGSKPTWFDITFAEAVGGFLQSKAPHLLQPHPKLVEFAAKIRSNPNLKKWIETRPKTEM